jgi:hypothetical protein
VVAFKVFPLISYAPMPAPSPTFKIVLKLVLWNGLQRCRSVTSDAIKYLFSIFPFPLGTEKSHWGLDPANKLGVQKQLFVSKISLTYCAV